MQAEEQHAQGVYLTFVEYGKEIRAAEEGEGGDVAQHIHKPDGGGDQNQGHHQRSMRHVHAAEQTVESQDQEDENDRGDQVSDDAETEKRLVSQDVVGGRGGVPPHDQSAGNIDQAEGGGDYE